MTPSAPSAKENDQAVWLAVPGLVTLLVMTLSLGIRLEENWAVAACLLSSCLSVLASLEGLRAIAHSGYGPLMKTGLYACHLGGASPLLLIAVTIAGLIIVRPGGFNL
jgi:hypothetical protein